MLSNPVLATLRCPEDRSDLALAGDTLVDQINVAIREGRLTSKSGKQIVEVLDGGLVRADGKRLYPIIQGIPLLLIDDAIDLEQDALA